MYKQTPTPRWHRGIHALHFGFLGGLVTLTAFGSLAISLLSPIWVQQANAAVSSFATGSFWNSSIPTYTALHPNSSQLVADISRQAGQFATGINKDTAASPVYLAESDTPVVTVVPWDCGSGIAPDLASQWLAVPVPFFASPGSNAQMVVYQPSSATVWEFGHVRNISGQWQACTGGRTSTATDGVFPSPYGVSASGLALLAGQLSVQELQSGQINHVIGLTLPQVNGFTWPATQTSGSNAGSPPMGLRLRLDPTININGLGLNSTGLAIARAAQTYGFIVWNSGSFVGVTGENPLSFTSRGLPDPYASLAISTALDNFPWDKLQALPQSAAQTADVPAITQFTASPSTIKADSRVTLSWQASNVNRCAIAGVVDNLGANGSTISGPLLADTAFVLRCGGPGGVTSSQTSVKVITAATNDRVASLAPDTVITEPYSGYANILPELMSAEAAQQVYKVVYYEQETYLFETAKPPFALNTTRMDNGKHAVDARIYYRDGRTEQRSAGITVNNSPETLFAVVQSSLIKAPPSIPLAWSLVAGLLVIMVMSAGTWWGWHKAHLT